VRLLNRYDKHGRHGGKHCAKDKDECIDTADRNPEGLCHLPIVLRCAHDKPDACACQHEPHPDDQYERGYNDDKLVSGIAEPWELDAEADWRLNRSRVRAVEGQYELLTDVEKADRRDDRRLWIVVDAPQHEPICNESNSAHYKRAEKKGQQIAEHGLAGNESREEPGEDCTQHVKLAVCNIHNPHDAEDKG
jgi:hypothetical protein